MYENEILEILEQEIIGDGQGSPDQEERIKAAKRLARQVDRWIDDACDLATSD